MAVASLVRNRLQKLCLYLFSFNFNCIQLYYHGTFADRWQFYDCSFGFCRPSTWLGLSANPFCRVSASARWRNESMMILDAAQLASATLKGPFLETEAKMHIRIGKFWKTVHRLNRLAELFRKNPRDRNRIPKDGRTSEKYSGFSLSAQASFLTPRADPKDIPQPQAPYRALSEISCDALYHLCHASYATTHLGTTKFLKLPSPFAARIWICKDCWPQPRSRQLVSSRFCQSTWPTILSPRPLPWFPRLAQRSSRDLRFKRAIEQFTKDWQYFKKACETRLISRKNRRPRRPGAAGSVAPSRWTSIHSMTLCNHFWNGNYFAATVISGTKLNRENNNLSQVQWFIGLK